jgi:ribonuclease HII
MKINKNDLLPNYFEKTAWKSDFFICGTDEVGRGCLAGPLVVSAAILPQKTNYKFLIDSKKLTEAQRNLAFSWISKNCWHTSIIINPRQIDRLNIYQATLKAMKKATRQLLDHVPIQISSRVKYVLADAMPLEITNPYNEKLECYSMNFGESYSNSIAAASIVAKVTRDRLMEKIGKAFPEFGFAKHKGYGTKLHVNSLKKLEKTIIHRSTYLKNFIMHNESEEQRTLF